MKETYDPNVNIKDLTEEENENVARQDIDDIIEADTIIFFAEDQNNQPPRGGRHVEFGYALALGLTAVVIGEKENIFHYLPIVKDYKTWAEYIVQEYY